MQAKEFKYKNKKIHYRTKGSGPLVVLLHGFGEDGTIWKNQFDIFPGHQLLVPDLPGSGLSESIDDMSMDGLAEAVKALIESLTPSPSPHGEGSEEVSALNSLVYDQKETGHFFKTADPMLWKTTKEYGRLNRKQPTKAEDLLWQNLRNNKQGVKFRRQHSIGGYIVDFAALEVKLVIEVDGGYHNKSAQQNADRLRQDTMEQHGYAVVRFSNEQVLHQMTNVLQQVRDYIFQTKQRKLLQSEVALLSARRGVGGEAILIGHSMGGYVTLALAEKYPEALVAFGLFHSTAFADNEAKKQGREKGIAEMKEAGAETFLKTFVPNLYAPATMEKRPALIDEHLAAAHNFSAESLVNYFEAMMQRPDRAAVLKSSQVPVLFVMGENDKAVPLEDSLKQCHLPRLSQVQLLQQSGHMGMMEEAEETNKILVQFVNVVENIAQS